MTELAQAFPRAARLLKTDEFSSVFALRPVRRSRHFVIYVREHSATEAFSRGRLGVVIGKKFAPRSVERNLLKRMIREGFRQRQAQFVACDIVVRLQAKFPRAEFTSRRALQASSQEQLASLFEAAIQRRRAVDTVQAARATSGQSVQDAAPSTDAGVV